MSQSPQRASPTAVFLGEQAARGGPFALLGLAPGSLSDESILEARDRRMRLIDAHPLAETPEADEVRLSLYAAAAQLLNPVIRAQLARSWGGATGARPAIDRPPLRPGSPEQMLEHDAILALAMYGGWNPRSLRRIVSIAHARGLGSDEVARTLRRLGRKRRPRAIRPASDALRARTPAPGQGEPVVSLLDPTPDQIDPAQQLLKMALLVTGVAILTLALLFGGVYAIIASDSARAKQTQSAGADGPGLAPDRGAPANPISRAGQPARAERTLPSPETLGDPLLVVHEIDGARRGLEFTPYESTRRFTDAVELLSSSWGAYTPEQLGRANDAVERFVETVVTPDVMRLTIDAIGAGVLDLSEPGGAVTPGRVWGAVWSGAMLAQIRDSHVLSATQRDQVTRLLRLAVSDAGGARGFRAGAISSARAVALRLAEAGGSREAWRRWVEVVDALGGESQVLRTEMLTESVEQLIESAPASAERALVIRDLALAMSWRRQGGARRWLVLMLQRPGVDQRALSGLVDALVSESAATGLDATMTLAPNAGERERRQLADRLSAVWSLGGDGRMDSFAQELLALYEEGERARTSGGDPVTRFEAVVRLAYANAGASLASAERFEEAGRALDAASTYRPPRVSGSGGDPYHAVEDGRWTLTIRSAGESPEQKLEALDRLRSQMSATIGPADAETLLHLAIRGSPRAVRERALGVVPRYAGSPAMVNALLERADDLPATPQMRDLVEVITARPVPREADAGAWRLSVRRALLETLIEAIARAGTGALVDSYEEELGVAYSMALGGSVSEDGSWAPLPLRDAARELARKLERQGARLGGGSPPAIVSLGGDESGLARHAHASTPMQSFLASQLSVCESLGVLVAMERRGASGEVSRILASLELELAAADHVLDQIAATESAIARLWLLREGVTP